MPELKVSQRGAQWRLMLGHVEGEVHHWAGTHPTGRREGGIYPMVGGWAYTRGDHGRSNCPPTVKRVGRLGAAV